MYQIKKIFLNFLLKVKNFLSTFSKKKKIENSFTFGNGKSVINQAASLEIKTKNEELQKEAEKIALKFVKKYLNDTNKTIEILETKNVRVYRTALVLEILKYINEKPGFIIPLKGFKGFYINFVTSLLFDKKLKFKMNSDEMFIFSTKEIDKFFFASQIYKFIAFRRNLSGFDFKNQEKFKKLYKNPNETAFSKLTAGDIFAVKEVIARETEATDFALKLSEEGLFVKK